VQLEQVQQPPVQWLLQWLVQWLAQQQQALALAQQQLVQEQRQLELL
jgi:hypothetical protein